MNKDYYTYEEVKDILKTYMKSSDIELVDKYYEYATKIFEGDKRLTGEDYIYHMTSVAYTLANLKMDPATIGCALIHEAISKEKSTFDEIKDLFGEESAIILSSLAKISQVKRTFNRTDIEHDRRVVVGLAENPKALFIIISGFCS